MSGHWFDDLVELDQSENKNPAVHAQLGCHNSENKLFYTQRVNGIMGLAPKSDMDYEDQMPTVLHDLFHDKKHITTKVFSLCLASWGGRLAVGGDSSSYHEGEVSWTPLRASYYYSVFPETLSLVPPGEASTSEGGIAAKEMRGDFGSGKFGITIMDSGTTVTYFPEQLFNDLVDALDMYCKENDCKAVRALGMSDCWRMSDRSGGPDRFPPIRFHFEGGAAVDWSPRGYLQRQGTRGLWCQSFMSSPAEQTVLGISWMQHKDVIFDLTNKRLGIAPAKCPEHHLGQEEEEQAAEEKALDAAEKAAGGGAVGMQRKFEGAAAIEDAAAAGRLQLRSSLTFIGVALAVALTATWALGTQRLRQRRAAANLASSSSSADAREDEVLMSRLAEREVEVPILCSE